MFHKNLFVYSTQFHLDTDHTLFLSQLDLLMDIWRRTFLKLIPNMDIDSHRGECTSCVYLGLEVVVDTSQHMKVRQSMVLRSDMLYTET